MQYLSSRCFSHISVSGFNEICHFVLFSTLTRCKWSFLTVSLGVVVRVELFSVIIWFYWRAVISCDSVWCRDLCWGEGFCQDWCCCSYKAIKLLPVMPVYHRCCQVACVCVAVKKFIGHVWFFQVLGGGALAGWQLWVCFRPETQHQRGTRVHPPSHHIIFINNRFWPLYLCLNIMTLQT